MADDDLPAVASLFERVSRSGSDGPAPGLIEYFARTLNHPMTDDELPSLVYENSSGRIVAFIGSHVRRGKLQDRTIRIRYTGQLVSGPDAGPAAGPLLLRHVFAGPQDMTITDGATPLVLDMWTRLGGHVQHVASIVWSRPFRPLREAGNRIMPGGRRLVRVAHPILDGADRLGRRWLRPKPHDSNLEAVALTPSDLVALSEAAADPARIRLDINTRFASWLMHEVSAVTARGTLAAASVLRQGQPIGWYVAYFKPGGVGHVLEIRSMSPADLDDVLDQLFHDAHMAGVTALEGRVDPFLFATVANRRLVLRVGERVLFHSSDHELVRLAACGDSDLSRLAGEWWMGHHLESIPRISRKPDQVSG